MIISVGLVIKKFFHLSKIVSLSFGIFYHFGKINLDLTEVADSYQEFIDAKMSFSRPHFVDGNTIATTEYGNKNLRKPSFIAT